MLSIWVFLCGLAIPFLLGYDIAKVVSEWIDAKYEIMIQKRMAAEEEECQ